MAGSGEHHSRISSIRAAAVGMAMSAPRTPSSEPPAITEITATASEEEAIGQDVAVKWQVEGSDDADPHSPEVTDHMTASDLRYHRRHGYSTWVPGHRQYGAVRHCVVNLHPGVRLTRATVLSRGGGGTTVQQIRLIRI